MKKISIKKLMTCIVGLLVCVAATAQSVPASPTLKTYDFNDQSCILNLSDNGKWAVSYGMSSTNSSESSNARLVNTETGEVTVLGLEGDTTIPLVCMAGDVTDDGMVVGMYQSVPATWTKEDGWQKLPLPSGWSTGQLESVTPDGKYAVGKTYNYSGAYSEDVLLYDLETRKYVETPNHPTVGSAGEKAQMIRYTSITSNGRYISGCVDYSYTWNTLYFIYDRETQSYSLPGFDSNGTPWVEGLMSANGAFSPNGEWYGGTAYIVANASAGEEYDVPFRYNMQTGEYTVYSDANARDYGCIQVDNEGTIYAATPASSTPIRTLYILVDGFWYPLDDLLSLRYGMDFYGVSNYDNTGTPMGISGDGKVLTAFPDPYESYVLRMNESFGTAARGVNLLKTYTSTPADGATITRLSSVEVAFRYDLQLVGDQTKVKLTDEDGKDYGRITGLSITGTNSRTLRVGFRSTTLEEGKNYTLTIQAGTVALSSDATRTNEEIVLHFTGRAATPVEVTTVSPEENTLLTQLNSTTNPILLTFDTDVKLADGASAQLYREGEDEPLATLNVATSTVASQSKMVMIYPASSTEYLYKGTKYTVVLPEGTVTDINGDNGNKEFSVSYEGDYERVVVSDDATVYSEDFSNGVNNMMLYDGDGNTPDDEMQGYDFQSAGDAYAWVPVRDADDVNFAAASTSAYSPKGQANDWMVTPQIYLPDDKCRLEFKAQGFRKAKEDKLKVIVYANDKVLNYFTETEAADFLANGEVLMNEVLSPGISEDVLAGDWTSYSFNLDGYAGKSIYIAFVNENDDQSIVFVDDVQVVRDNGFLTALLSPTTVVNQSSQVIRGRLTANAEGVTYNNLSVQLLDADKNVIDTHTADGLSLSKGDTYDFTFTKELPLNVGKENTFYFNIAMGDASDEVSFTIKDLVFQPTKRVVVEEMTGQACPNCPRGILAMENLEKLYGDLVIPICYHTYSGDSYERGMTSYVRDFLLLSGAPSAKINRGTVVGDPMYDDLSNGVHNFVYTSPAGDCWLDLVQAEFETDADADLSISATYDHANGTINVPYTARFALDQERKNIGLFMVVTEDGLAGYQENTYYTADPASYIGLGEWVSGGAYGQRAVLYTHNDVASALVGSSYYGTTGYIPSTITSGEDITGTLSFERPSVTEISNCNVVCMMIDANTGRVINSAKAKLVVDPTGIDSAVTDSNATVVARYNAAGQVISAPQRGLNIVKYSDGTTRKVIVK